MASERDKVSAEDLDEKIDDAGELLTLPEYMTLKQLLVYQLSHAIYSKEGNCKSEYRIGQVKNTNIVEYVLGDIAVVRSYTSSSLEISVLRQGR